jgi:hypothetical protein
LSVQARICVLKRAQKVQNWWNILRNFGKNKNIVWNRRNPMEISIKSSDCSTTSYKAPESAKQAQVYQPQYKSTKIYVFQTNWNFKMWRNSWLEKIMKWSRNFRKGFQTNTKNLLNHSWFPDRKYVWRGYSPKTLRARVVSYALGAYEIFIESTVVETSKKAHMKKIIWWQNMFNQQQFMCNFNDMVLKLHPQKIT